MAVTKKFKILLKDGSQKEVEGYIFGEWGIDKRTIVYGSNVTKDGLVKPLSFTAYYITHLATGKHLPLGTCRTLKNAKLLLSEPEFFGKITPETIKNAIERFAGKVGWDY